MKKKYLAILLALCLVLCFLPAVALANGEAATIEVTANDDIAEILESANDGDTLVFAEGTYTLPEITKAVNLKAEGDVIIEGNIMYNVDAEATEGESITVEGLTIQGQDLSENVPALCWSRQNVLNGYTLNVINCTFENWKYGVAVNSGASECVLNVTDSAFENVWCAASVKTTSNRLETFDATTPEDCFAIQAFNLVADEKVNSYYDSYEKYEADEATWDVIADPDAYEVPASMEAKAGNTYDTLKNLVESATEDVEITLLADVALTDSIVVPAEVDITINGNNNTISYNGGTTKVAFTNFGDTLEGVLPGTQLTVNDVIFQSTSNEPAGYAVLVGFNSFGTEITLTGCTFENLYAGIYANPVTAEGSPAPKLSITESTYTNTNYGYCVDEVTNGAQVGNVDVTFEDNTVPDEGFQESEVWNTVTVTKPDGSVTAYNSWEAAYAAAAAGDTITLNMDVTGPITIDKDNITINGNGKEITATGTDTAVTISADNVTLKDVNASSQWDIALVVANGATGAEVNGGSYATCTDTGNFTEDYAKQGEGAIRFMGNNGDITVTGADLTGGLHIVNYTEGTVKASDNTIGFDYTGETAVVGILVQGEGASNLSGDSLFKNNEVTVPNTNSFYVQVRDDAGTVNEKESVSATTSTVKIGNAFYPSLQAAVDAVEEGGVITLVANNSDKATVGRKVTFTLKLEDGVAFTGSIKAKSGWRVAEKDGVYTVTKRASGGGSLSGGSSSSADTYDIDIASGLTNGTVKANVSSAEEGDTVTLTVTPATGYVLSTLTVTDADDNTVSTTAKSNGTYTFTMPDADVEVTATFVEGTASDIYTDVPANAWYANAVNYVTKNGLMNGYGDGLFGPNDVFSRAMVAQVIYNMENKPAVSTSGSFNDVTAGAWYADAINWAAQNEIVNGNGDGTFAPNNQITREQMAAVLYRYAQYKGYDVTAKADLSTFSDAASVSAYATDAMQWIVASGIMEGMDGTLVPQGNATRAQVATMLMRFAENVAK